MEVQGSKKDRENLKADIEAGKDERKKIADLLAKSQKHVDELCQQHEKKIAGLLEKIKDKDQSLEQTIEALNDAT